MKKLQDFQAEKAEIKSIYGGLIAADATKTDEYCTCSSGHYHLDHTTHDK